jgi:hypothetical protein
VKAAKQLGAARKRGGEAASDAGGNPYDGGSVRTTADQPQSLSVIGTSARRDPYRRFSAAQS